MVKLTYQGRSLEAPVFVQPGMAEGAIVLHLGYGRTRGGRAAEGMGFNPYGLRTAQALWQDTGLEAVKVSGEHVVLRRAELSCTGDAGPPPYHPQGHAGGVQEESGVGARGRRGSAARTDHVSRSGTTRRATPGA